MSEATGEHGQGKTGGLPGANADPRTAELPADQLAEVSPAEVADDGGQRDA